MKHFLSILLMLLLLSAPASAEKIIWEDDSGQLLLADDGTLSLVSLATEPPEEALLSEEEALALTPTPTPRPVPEKTYAYGDSGDDVLAAQERLTDLGYYHGKCSGNFLEGTQSAVRRFQRLNALRETGKLDPVTFALLFSPAAIARDGSTPDATPSPVPTPAPFSYSRKLEYGDSGAAVEQLQTRLAELGFYTSKVSGGFYKVTRAAVKDFQTHNGLHADGIAGEETQALLFSGDARSVSDAPLPTPTPIPTKYKLMVDVTNQITRAYTYDENGEYTVLVREMICSTGTKSNPTPLGTTIMPKSRARWGYFPTWGSHAQYLTRIDSANAFHSVLYAEPDPTTLAVSSFKALGSRASHGCVRLMVGDAKWIYDNCAAGTIITVYEGEYDPEYTMTLKRSLNNETLRENPAPKPTPAPEYREENWPKKYRTLSKGASGEDVFMVQSRLTELGYYHGSITGGYYGGTIEAVTAFQKDHGLTVDGSAGKQTQSVLFSHAVDPTPVPTDTPAPTETPAPTLLPTDSPAPTGTPGAVFVIPTLAPDAQSVPAGTKTTPISDSVG